MKAVFSHIKEHWIKYSLETIVVMAGILGAYALNNWNEVRKDNKIELEIYAELNASLKSDSVKLVETIGRLKLCKAGLEKVVNNNPSDLIKEGNLGALLNNIMEGAYSFFPKSGTWQQITNNNQMYLLNVESMKSKLVDLYDFQYPRYINIDNIIDDKFQNPMMEVVAGDIGYIADVTGAYDNSVNRERFKQNFDKLSRKSRESMNITYAALDALIEIELEVNELLMMTRNELEKQ
jgi:hypothetical protein